MALAYGWFFCGILGGPNMVVRLMGEVDALVVTALLEEYEAARLAALLPLAGNPGIQGWRDGGAASTAPYLIGSYRLAVGPSLTIALARPTRMGPDSTASIAASLVERLRPRCLAMCGVCAGNPGEVGLGDIVIAEMAYRYTEGKQTSKEFLPDVRPIQLHDEWLRAAQELSPAALPSHGEASEEESRLWFLERLHAGDQPRVHPARSRFFPGDTWRIRLEAWQTEGLINWVDGRWELSAAGRNLVQYALYHDVVGPDRLPFAIKAGPIASGDVVVKDGRTWNRLAQSGVRSVIGLEMEAATIATTAHRLNVPFWTVIKGVMDHADPRKDDRYKPFAARASAQVLWAFLARQLVPAVGPESPEQRRIRAAVNDLLQTVDGLTSATSAHPARSHQGVVNALGRLLRLLDELDASAVHRASDVDAVEYRRKVRTASERVRAAYHQVRTTRAALPDLAEAAVRLRREA